MHDFWISQLAVVKLVLGLYRNLLWISEAMQAAVALLGTVWSEGPHVASSFYSEPTVMHVHAVVWCSEQKAPVWNSALIYCEYLSATREGNIKKHAYVRLSAHSDGSMKPQESHSETVQFLRDFSCKIFPVGQVMCPHKLRWRWGPGSGSAAKWSLFCRN